jgi:hypothetical protein
MGIENLEKHSGSYKPDAWRQYTPEELQWWVKLLRKRASHRTDEAKRKKDLYDADNYQAMLDEMYLG